MITKICHTRLSLFSTGVLLWWYLERESFTNTTFSGSHALAYGWNSVKIKGKTMRLSMPRYWPRIVGRGGFRSLKPPKNLKRLWVLILRKESMARKLQLLFMFVSKLQQLKFSSRPNGAEQPITVLIFNGQKADNLCYVVVSECSGIWETEKRPGLTENVKVQLNR